MQKTIKVNDQISVGGQPTENELKEFAQAGFKTVVNLRTPNEENQSLKPEEEGRVVKGSGMEYLHMPVSLDAMNETQVDDFRRHVTQLPAPIFVHCASGKRAGAFAMMHTALEQGLSGEQALQTAEQMGFECDQPRLREFVKNYIDESMSPQR